MVLVASLTLGETCVDLYRHGIDTVFPDGTNVWAEPQDTDAYRATAERLGYGADTLQMCLDHELLHSVNAAFQGLPWSPTLYHLRHPPYFPLWREEEAAVLAFQEYYRKSGVVVFDLACSLMKGH